MQSVIVGFLIHFIRMQFYTNRKRRTKSERVIEREGKGRHQTNKSGKILNNSWYYFHCEHFLDKNCQPIQHWKCDFCLLSIKYEQTLFNAGKQNYRLIYFLCCCCIQFWSFSIHSGSIILNFLSFDIVLHEIQKNINK